MSLALIETHGTGPYATAARVVTVLGPIGARLPADVIVSEHVSLAHARLLDALRDVYGDTVPTFADDGLEAVSWAEAKLAASSVLSALLTRIPSADRSAIVDLRAEALESVKGGVPGYAPGTMDPDGTGPAPSLPSGPSSSSGTLSSLFSDPYNDAATAYLL